MTTPSSNLTAAHLFKSPLQSWVFILPNGKRLNFIKGICITSDPKEIAHLNMEIDLGHPSMYVDPNEITVSLDRTDPVAALKGRMRLEVLKELQAEMAAATDPNNDMGNSDPGKFTPASTSSIAAVTANGDAAARLANLRNSVAKVADATVVVKQTGPVPFVVPVAETGV